MAEGGEPAPKNENDEEVGYPKFDWDRGSLVYVFASDFIHFVIERVDRTWKSNGLIIHRSPLTPFNTAIQNAVEGVLKQDYTCLRIVFGEIMKRFKPLNQHRFNICAVLLKVTYFGNFRSFGALLKYFCALAQFSVWALEHDLHTAPFFCVDIIMGYIREFSTEQNFGSMDEFWYFFEQEARDALIMPNIWLLNERELRSLPVILKLTEDVPEEPSGMEETADDIQIDEAEKVSENLVVSQEKQESNLCTKETFSSEASSERTLTSEMPTVETSASKVPTVKTAAPEAIVEKSPAPEAIVEKSPAPEAIVEKSPAPEAIVEKSPTSDVTGAIAKLKLSESGKKQLETSTASVEYTATKKKSSRTSGSSRMVEIESDVSTNKSTDTSASKKQKWKR